MKNDKYLKFVMTVIAVCLVLLVARTFISVPSAEAKEYSKSSNSSSDETVLVVKEIASIPYEDLVNIYSIDNQRTFIATGKKGFVVYRLEYKEK